MSETGYVYTLNDPRDNSVKYVGATKDPQERLKGHLQGSTNEDMTEWIQELEANGHKPTLTVVDVTSLEELAEAELEVIERLSEEWELLNAQRKGYINRNSNEPVESTTIPIESDTRDRLRALKEGNETYTEVIERLIDEHDYMAFEGGEP